MNLPNESIPATLPSPARAESFHSWKCVANYVGKSVRTVQRWERFGLPIRRPAQTSKGPIMVFQAELDAWMLSFFSRDMHHQKPEIALLEKPVTTGTRRWENLQALADLIEANRALVKQITLSAGPLAVLNGRLPPLNLEVSWRFTAAHPIPPSRDRNPSF